MLSGPRGFSRLDPAASATAVPRPVAQTTVLTQVYLVYKCGDFVKIFSVTDNLIPLGSNACLMSQLLLNSQRVSDSGDLECSVCASDYDTFWSILEKNICSGTASGFLSSVGRGMLDPQTVTVG